MSSNTQKRTVLLCYIRFKRALMRKDHAYGASRLPKTTVLQSKLIAVSKQNVSLEKPVTFN